MVQPTLEREKTSKDLADLCGSTGEEEGSEGEGEDGGDEKAELDEAVGLKFCECGLAARRQIELRIKNALPVAEKQCRRKRKTKKGGAR